MYNVFDECLCIDTSGWRLFMTTGKTSYLLRGPPK